MDIEKLRNFCLSMEGVTEKTPFGKFARRFDSILVFYVCDHMFCMVDMEDFNYVSFRSTPEEIDTIMADYVSAGVPANRDEILGGSRAQRRFFRQGHIFLCPQGL